MKQATPAQLAARAKFAAAARSGAFKRKARPATKRLRNPVDVPDVTVEMEDTRNGQVRRFDSEFFVGRDSIDPGWFVWGRWGGVGKGQGVIKKVAWPAGPARKWPKISRLVQPGFRTKGEAQDMADRLAAGTVKRNPVGPKDGPGAEYFVKVRGRGWVREYARNATPDRWRYVRSFADAQVFSEGQAVSIKTMCDHVMAPCELMEVREANPKGRKVHNSTGYGVITPKALPYRVEAEGPAGFGMVADFVKLEDAKQYARAYADGAGVRVRITGKGIK